MHTTYARTNPIAAHRRVPLVNQVIRYDSITVWWADHKRFRRKPRTGLQTVDDARDSLPIGPADHVHQLGNLAPLVDLVAGSDRMFNAMCNVVAQDLLLGTPERRAHGGNLGDNIDAVAVALDHAGEAADLPLDPVEPFEAGVLDLAFHTVYIPLPGIRDKE